MKSTVYKLYLPAVAVVAMVVAVIAPDIAAAGGSVSLFSGRPDRFVEPARATSSFLAGYRTKKSVTTITSASNTFTVPSYTCTSALQAISLGIGNERKKGKPTLLGVVVLDCPNGAPDVYLLALAGEDAQFSESVSPGDTLKVEITQNGGTVTSKVTNTTTSAVLTASGTPAPDNAVTFGAFPLFHSGDLVGVPDFGSVELKTNQLNGAKIKKNVQPLPRMDGATVQISVGSLTKGNFTLTFENH